MAITDSVTNRKVVSQLVRYSWIRANAGYEWIAVKVSGQQFIEGTKRVRLKPENDYLLVELDRSKWHHGLAHTVYDAPADLFDSFAKTAETKESIKAFADQFGKLGYELGKGATRFPDDAVSGLDWRGELLSYWCRAITQMRDAVALWRAIADARNGDESTLIRYVKWDASLKHVGVRLRPGRSRRWKYNRDAAFGTFSLSDLIRPAEEFLREELMLHLTGSLSIGLKWNSARSQLVRSFRPNSLLALMWLQFADALTGETEFRPCKRKGCPNLIRISPEHGSHTNKQTCSDSCKVRMYQERVKAVIASFDRGKTPEQIAPAVKAELSTVRGWIARELRKRGETITLVSVRLRIKPGEVRKLLQVKAAGGTYTARPRAYRTGVANTE